MKSSNAKIFGLLAATVAASTSLCVGCAKENSLTIDDMLVYANGAPVTIETVFSGKAETVKYTYDDYAIDITDGKMVCYKAGVYTVVAESESCRAEFEVTCKNAADIQDLKAWVGYPASDISPFINIPNETAITYSTDSDILTIDGNYVTAVKAGTAEVTADVAGYKTSFTVTCLDVNKTDPPYYMWGDGWNWVGKATDDRTKYNKDGTDGKTTVFIGDSFFDPDFFTTFYQFYGDYDALCLGIGGTTSHQWEMFLDGTGVYPSGKYGQLAGIRPKNAVVQLGNNNIYNDQDDEKKTVEDLQRFFTFMHGVMPETKIYYFGVTPRNVAMASWKTTVLKVNAAMGEFCANKDWIVFLDTTDQMTPDKLKDNIHPKPAEYKIFVDALSAAGLELEYK